MKETKQQKIKRLERVIEGDHKLILARREEVDELKNKLSEMEKIKERAKRILFECNLRADMLNHIMNILMGEANPKSKYEVLRDIFLGQIKEHEKNRKLPVQNIYHDPLYPSHLNQRILNEVLI